MVLHQDPVRWMCPVCLFLGMALEDRAFIDCNSFSELERRHPPPGSVSYQFRFKGEMARIPVLRALQSNDWTISPTHIITYDCLNNHFKGIGQRAGYGDRFTAYCIRRGFANRVQSKDSFRHPKHETNDIEEAATSKETQKLMGQSGDAVFQTYMSAVVGFDTQSVMQDRPPLTALVETNQTMLLKRRTEAPHPPGSRLTDVSRNMYRLTGGNEEPVLQLPADYKKRRQMRLQRYIKERKRFFREAEDSFVELDAGTNPTKDEPVFTDRKPSRYLEAVLKHDPDRQKVIEIMFHDSKYSLADLIEPLVRMCRTQRVRSNYMAVQEITKGGYCPYCQKMLDM